MTPSSILFQNGSKSVVLLDLPRSLEEAQLPSHNRLDNQPAVRLRSVKPPERPFPTPEPKTGAFPQTAPNASAQVTELMTSAAAEAALSELRESYDGPWCLPRLVPELETATEPAQSRKRKGQTGEASDHDTLDLFIPSNSQYLSGSIESQRAVFVSKAPVFDLIVLDPPWPNRSVKRKKQSYQTASDLESIRELLSLVPIASHLSADGIVAVWVTNAARFADLLVSPRGLFAEWGVELVDEWTWLKVTTGGEPIVSMESRWRKPWERLLIARKRGSSRRMESNGKVIVAVPELHSRKPNLRGLFEPLLRSDYVALEVFARNLTAGWWCWGDEVLQFQRRDYWAISEEGHGPLGTEAEMEGPEEGGEKERDKDAQTE